MKSIAISVKKKTVLLWLERILFVVALVCLGFWLYSWIDAAYYQYRENKLLDESLSKGSEAPPSPGKPSAADTDSLGSFQPRAVPRPAPPRKPPLEEGALVGRIEIPRLGISTIVLEGGGTRTPPPRVRPHPRAAPPRARRNWGLAAHRDGFFRGLKDIRKNDIT